MTSVDLKKDEQGIFEAARRLARPVVFVSRDQLRAVSIPNPSSQVERHIGVKSVCEATALKIAKNGELIVEKKKTRNVTVAVAKDVCM